MEAAAGSIFYTSCLVVPRNLYEASLHFTGKETKTRRAQVAWPSSQEVLGPCLDHCLCDSALCSRSQSPSACLPRLSDDLLRCPDPHYCRQRPCQIRRAICWTKVRHKLQRACEVMNDLVSSSGADELSGPAFSYPRPSP